MSINTSNISEQERINIEFEFVQNLSNPSYLHFLAINKYFDDKQFMIFLKYLRYWKSPEYLQYLAFPQCLTFLDNLIDNPTFREKLRTPKFRDLLHQQQGYQWMFGN